MTKISQLSDIGAGLAAADEFIVRDVSDVSTPNKKVTASGFADYIISQGTGAGFSQIAAGVGPLARVRAVASGSTGTVLLETANGGSIVERARLDPSGRLLVGTSAANTSGAKLQTSDGLTFPAAQVASADPNTLDDYEEGTWTPVYSYSSFTASGITVTDATYTKIGRTVFLKANVTFTGTSAVFAEQDRFIFTGLPFANSGSNTGSVGTIWVSADFGAGSAALGTGFAGASDYYGSFTRLMGVGPVRSNIVRIAATYSA